jgi:hypothetical protein
MTDTDEVIELSDRMLELLVRIILRNTAGELHQMAALIESLDRTKTKRRPNRNEKSPSH